MTGAGVQALNIGRQGLFMDRETSAYERDPADGMGPDESSGHSFARAGAQNNTMASLAFVAGILAVFSTFLIPVYLPLIFGSLAIVEGLLSRGCHNMSQRAALGVALGVFGIILNMSIMAVGIYTYMTNDALREEISRLIESMQMYMY